MPINRGNIRFFGELFLPFFARLVLGQFKTSNHLSFDVVWLKGLPKAPNHHWVSSLCQPISSYFSTSWVCFFFLQFCLVLLVLSQGILSTLLPHFSKSRTIHAFSTSQPWAVWHKARAQHSVVSSNSSAGSLVLFGLKIFCGYITSLLLSSGMPSMQFTWNCRCVLITLRHRWQNRMCTNVTYAASQSYLPVTIQHSA